MLTIEDATKTRKTLHRQVRRETPWGVADFMTTFGPGVTSSPTPSHGGFFVEHSTRCPNPSARSPTPTAGSTGSRKTASRRSWSWPPRAVHAG